MHSAHVAMTLLLGVTSIAYAAPVEDPFKGYTIVPAVWEIEATPGEGNYVTLNGTIEKVYPELLEINPNYEQEYEEFVAENEAPKSVEKRTDFSTSKYFCNGRWTAISTGEIAKGISYLRRVGGQPRMGAGPGTCARVSCSWNAAIFWCNDERSTKTLNSFGSIADGAEWLRYYCSKPTGDGIHSVVAGQVFHATTWNVIVTASSC